MSARDAWPLAVGVLTALVIAALVLDAPPAVGGVLVGAFVLVAPGLALLPLALPDRPREVALLAVPAGMAVSVVVGTAAMYAVGLSDATALRCLLAVCGAGAVAQLARRPGRAAVRAPRS